MRKVWLGIIAAVFCLGLGLVIAGGDLSTASKDKMSGDKMAGDKMVGDKMGTDKMSGDRKMEGDK
jgi:pentapeptide MXKDX repeat protein